MRDTSHQFGIAGGQLPGVENADDPGGDNGAGLFKVGVGTAQIAVDIATAAHRFNTSLAGGFDPGNTPDVSK